MVSSLGAPLESYLVPDADEQLAKALAKQKEVMLAKIQYESEKHQNAIALKQDESRHLSAMRKARNEAYEGIRLNSVRRETRRNKVLEKRIQLKAKEDEDYLRWKAALRRRNREVMNQTFTESRASQRTAMKAAKRQHEFEEFMSKKQETEQISIHKRLSSFEEKMQRHDSLHKFAIKSVTDKVSAKAHKAKELNLSIESIREQNGTKRAMRLVEKHEISSRRREEIDKIRLMKISEHRRAESDKRRQILDRVKKAEGEIRTKSQFLEQKMQISEQVLLKKFETWSKDLTIRHELSKLKNEDTLETAERRRRIEGERRKQIIERHLRDSQRLEELKQTRGQLSSQSRDVQYKAKQERERLKSELIIVSKSPESSKAKEILKSFESPRTITDLGQT